jgi:uncharacterized protein (TIGR02453 family)
MAGYYFHLQPGNSLVACGLWCPEPNSLKAVRSEISTHFSDFEAIVKDPIAIETFGDMWGESLKNVPRGFDKEDPAAEWLKKKSFMFEQAIPDESLTTDFKLTQLLQTMEQTRPLVQFLNQAFVR